jgi:hypothetical protein
MAGRSASASFTPSGDQAHSIPELAQHAAPRLDRGSAGLMMLTGEPIAASRAL